MILDNTAQEKPQIDYPCEWGFKLIGKDKQALEESIADILSDKEHRCHFGNSSKNGKFVSYNAYCQVDNEDERNRIFKAFEIHKNINMVI